jgi:hypothetical protein
VLDVQNAPAIAETKIIASRAMIIPKVTYAPQSTLLTLALARSDWVAYESLARKDHD